MEEKDYFKYIPQYHEWRLACEMEKALKEEDYEYCQVIQIEVDKRIERGTLDKHLMNGFKYYNPKTERYEGKPCWDGINGLFDKYKYD